MQKLIQIKDIKNLIKDGNTILVGGFGMSGTPLSILDEIATTKLKELTVISNNLGEKDRGLAKLLNAGNLKKAIGSYFTTGGYAVKAWLEGEIELELIPQGTFAEAIRCGGAGIGGFYTRTTVGTELAKGKELKVIDGLEYVFEKAIKADVAIIKALKADTLGNLIYDTTALNFNHIMATSGKIVIAEVDEIIEVGAISPEKVQTPHVYVDYIIKSNYIKKGSDYVDIIHSY